MPTQPSSPAPRSAKPCWKPTNEPPGRGGPMATHRTRPAQESARVWSQETHASNARLPDSNQRPRHPNDNERRPAICERATRDPGTATNERTTRDRRTRDRHPEAPEDRPTTGRPADARRNRRPDGRVDGRTTATSQRRPTTGGPATGRPTDARPDDRRDRKTGPTPGDQRTRRTTGNRTTDRTTARPTGRTSDGRRRRAASNLRTREA